MCRPWGYLLLCTHIWERCHPGMLTRANIKNVSLAVLKPNAMRSRSGKIRFFISFLKQVFCKQDSNDQTVIQAEPFTLRNTWQSTRIIFFNAFSRGLLLAQAGCSIKCWPTTLNFSNFPFTKPFFFRLPHLLPRWLCISGTWKCAEWVCGHSTCGPCPHGSQTPAVCGPSPRRRDRGSYCRWRRQTSASPGNGTGRASRVPVGRTGRMPIHKKKKMWIN